MAKRWNNVEEVIRWDTEGEKHNPSRAEQLDILLAVMADAYVPGNWVLDLGFGSGKVEKLMFARIPHARVVGIDGSREMMKLAAERLAGERERYEAIEHDLAELSTLQLPKRTYQFAIAVQSLHHLPPDRMQAAYRWIYEQLAPNGLFLLLDRIKVDTPGLWPVYRSVWSRLDRLYGSVLAGHEGDSFAEHERIVRERGDLPVGLTQHLEWLRASGFEAACLHLHGHRALIAGRKEP